MHITSYNSNASVTQIFVRYKLLLENGEILNNTFSHVPNTDRSAKVDIINIGVGWLLFISVDTGTISNKRGQTFVTIRNYDSIAALATFNLVSHYVDNSNNASWPFGVLESSLDGSGFIRAFTGTDPAPVNEINEIVPTGARWRIRSMTVILVTGGGGVARTPGLVFNDGTNDFLNAGTEVQPAGGTTTRLLWQEMSLKATVSQPYTPSNIGTDIILFAGFRIKTNTAQLQGADDYGAPLLYIEEWLEP